MLTHHILLPYCLPLLSLSNYCYREVDRGSRATLVGLGVNVLSTSATRAAGCYMNSAALFADAGHSLSGKHALLTSCPSL